MVDPQSCDGYNYAELDDWEVRQMLHPIPSSISTVLPVVFSPGTWK
jgi:hypothetical protein